MMTSAQVVETSVTVTDNNPFQDYPHPDDHTTQSTVTPRFKPFTVLHYYTVCQEIYIQTNEAIQDQFSALFWALLFCLHKEYGI